MMDALPAKVVHFPNDVGFDQARGLVPRGDDVGCRVPAIVRRYKSYSDVVLEIKSKQNKQTDMTMNRPT